MTVTHKIAVCIFNRATYVRCASFVKRLGDYAEVTVFLGSSVIDEEYGNPAEYIGKDLGIKVKISKINLPPDINNVQKTSLLMDQFSQKFKGNPFDLVVVVADRFETLAPAIVASMYNIPVCHIQGGEVTGNIDEKVRHAITKLADYHLCSTVISKDFLIRMGEHQSRVWLTGCPAIDMMKSLKLKRKKAKDAFCMLQFHPHTLDVSESVTQLEIVLEAVARFCAAMRHKCYIYYPNVDSGREEIVSAIDRYVKQFSFLFMKIVNEEPKKFLTKLSQCSFIIGNSSATIRESSYLGTPAINIGGRQGIRERSLNVIDIEATEVDEVDRAMHQQFNYGKYNKSFLFGVGDSARDMVDKLIAIDKFSIKPALTYPYLAKFNFNYFGQGRTKLHGKSYKFNTTETRKKLY